MNTNPAPKNRNRKPQPMNPEEKKFRVPFTQYHDIFFIIAKWELTPTAKDYLITCMGTDDGYGMSQDFMYMRTGITEKNVARVRKQLIKKGFISHTPYKEIKVEYVGILKLYGEQYWSKTYPNIDIDVMYNLMARYEEADTLQVEDRIPFKMKKNTHQTEGHNTLSKTEINTQQPIISGSSVDNGVTPSTQDQGISAGDESTENFPIMEEASSVDGHTNQDGLLSYKWMGKTFSKWEFNVQQETITTSQVSWLLQDAEYYEHTDNPKTTEDTTHLIDRLLAALPLQHTRLGDWPTKIEQMIRRVRQSGLKEVTAESIHLYFNNLPRYNFESLASIPIRNGIYIMFEKGETLYGVDRIVRVGTHVSEGRLANRLVDHFNKEDKNGSIFRKNIGRALLNQKNDPYIRIWNLDTRKQDVYLANRAPINVEKELQLEREICRTYKHFTIV